MMQTVLPKFADDPQHLPALVPERVRLLQMCDRGYMHVRQAEQRVPLGLEAI
jgi:hypothetical protein